MIGERRSGGTSGKVRGVKAPLPEQLGRLDARDGLVSGKRALWLRPVVPSVQSGHHFPREILGKAPFGVVARGERQ
jgi:hypothetical protein